MGAFLGLGSGLVASFLANSEFGFAAAIGVLLSSGLVFSLFTGGTAVVQHYALRIIVALHNYAPLNCVRFYDYASERVILHKVGGGYIFVHRMLLEYFASLELETQSDDTDSSAV